MSNALVALFDSLFGACPNATILVDGKSILARNTAFAETIGDASSLNDCIDANEHAALFEAAQKGTTVEATPTRGSHAGKRMLWTAWPTGDGLHFLRIDGPAITRDNKWAPLAGFLPKEPEAIEVALLLYELHKRTDSAFWAIAKDGTIILSEGKALAYFGIKPGQIVGLNAFEIYPPGSRALEQTIQVLGGESLHIDNLEAGHYWVSWAEPVRDDLGAVTGMFGQLSRISENSAETMQAKLLLGVVENLPIAIWSMERDGTCTLSTGQALRDLGFEPNSLVGQTFMKCTRAIHNLNRTWNASLMVRNWSRRSTLETWCGETTSFRKRPPSAMPLSACTPSRKTSRS